MRSQLFTSYDFARITDTIDSTSDADFAFLAMTHKNVENVGQLYYTERLTRMDPMIMWPTIDKWYIYATRLFHLMHAQQDKQVLRLNERFPRTITAMYEDEKRYDLETTLDVVSKIGSFIPILNKRR